MSGCLSKFSPIPAHMLRETAKTHRLHLGRVISYQFMAAHH